MTNEEQSNRQEAVELSEERESIWSIAISPSIWAAHFVLSYVVAALWCGLYGGRESNLMPARLAIGTMTVLALLGVFQIARGAKTRHRYGRGEPPHDEDTPEDRHRFLGYATLLLSALSGVAILYTAFAIVFLESCW